jgi:hypothetical protein
MQLYLGFYLKDYMFWAFTMPIIRSNITAKAAFAVMLLLMVHGIILIYDVRNLEPKIYCSSYLVTSFHDWLMPL